MKAKNKIKLKGDWYDDDGQLVIKDGIALRTIKKNENIQKKQSIIAWLDYLKIR